MNFTDVDTFDRLVVSATGNYDGTVPFVLSTPVVAGVTLQQATLSATLAMWR